MPLWRCGTTWHDNGWVQRLLLPEHCCSTGCCEPMPSKAVAASAAAQGLSIGSHQDALRWRLARREVVVAACFWLQCLPSLHGLRVPGLPAGLDLCHPCCAVNGMGCAVLFSLWWQTGVCEATREEQ